MNLHGMKCRVLQNTLALATRVTASKLLHIFDSLKREKNGAAKTHLSSAIGIPTCEF